MANLIQNIKKFISPNESKKGKNLANYITPIQLKRLSHDVSMWRASMEEAERAYFPYRVKQQRMYIDNILNGHTEACWNRRKDLTLLRDFTICDEGGAENEEITKLFKKQWFTNLMNFALDAQAYGYSLIALGDVENDNFPNIEVIKRWNISPDRNIVTNFEYNLSGINFLEEKDVRQWHIWVPTINEIGTSTCGYGFLYKVALYEIYLKSVLGFNVDYAQNFGMPLRVGKTNKTDEGERGVFEAALQRMGSDAYALLDMMDEIELIETKGSGQGYKVYESLEARCEKKISKIILGHADVMDSVPGKLGNDGEKSPAQKALEDAQTKDARFIEPIVNDQLIPRMREIGFNIPEGLVFEFKNDQEKEEFRQREDKSNAETANIAYTMKQAGLVMDAKYFEERTGIPTKVVPPIMPSNKPIEEKIQNKLKNLYK